VDPLRDDLAARELVVARATTVNRAAPLIAWSLWTISLLGTIALVVFFLTTGQASMMSTPLADSLYLLALFAFPTVGAIVASRRPRNIIGWLFCLTGPGIFIQLGLPAYADWELSRMTESPTGILAAWLAQATYLPFFAVFAVVLLVFPTGRLPSYRWLPAMVVVLGSAALGAVGYALLPTVQILGSVRVSNLFAIESEFPRLAATVGDALFTFVGMPLAALSLIIRLARARGKEQQQLKWFAYAGALAAPAMVGGSVFYGTQPAMFISGVAVLGVPIATGIAILRYRLYDIDLLINRTVVYGVTSAAIGATFFVGIIALQTLLHPLTAGSELSVAISTLASFALFQPILRRVQGTVDRHFDRSRYDAARTLDAFADQLRDEVDLDALRSNLLGAVRRTMAPTHASLWLRERAR
jgi:hypothetical protein